MNIGVAAHISAASLGGPRYDPKMSSAERSSIENGIWLCQNCSNLIDRDVHTYTMELLKQWKSLAETRAKEELGQIPISREHHEAMQSIVFGSNLKQKVSDPVATLCRVAAESMERKDPRFKIEVERSRGQTTYTYHAREVVHCSLSIKEEYAAEFSEKLSNLFRHGEELKIESNAVMLEGSPLFEQFRGCDGVFGLRSENRRRAAVVIELVAESGDSIFFAEVSGDIVVGSESLRFDGKGLNDLFDLELIFPRDSTKVRVNSAFDFRVWENKDITQLPGFDRAWSYYECARNGRAIKLTVEVEGTQLARLEGKIPSRELSSLALLPYLRNARMITAACCGLIKYRSNARISWEEFDAINSIRARLELSDPAGLASAPTMTLAPPPGKGIQHVEEYISSSAGFLQLQEEIDGLTLFDQPVPPFLLMTGFSNARLKRLGRAKKGSIKAEIVPMENCSISCTVQNRDAACSQSFSASA